MNVGDVLSDSVRRSVAPAARAARAAWTSMSNRISVWSQTKPIGHDEEAARAGGGAFGDELAEIGADPRLGRPAGALVRDVEPADAGARRDAAGRRRDFVRVHVAALDDPDRQAVRREHDRLVGARRRGPHPFGERLEQQRMRVKRA